MKYINLFDTQAAYDAAEKYYPNTSYIEATDEVVYQEISPEPHSDIIVAKFTTTSANQNVKITSNQERFSDISIEGQSQTIGTGALNHTFASAGEHEVEYKALDTTLIPDSAFYECTDLTSITIPDSVTSIGSAFYECTGLTSITIPDSVTSIGDSAFSGCTGLTEVTIPNSVTTIGGSAFYECTGLTSVTIGNSVTEIGEDVFVYCTGLTSIVVENGNTKYDSRDNCNAIIETESNTLIAGCNNTIIPDSVTTIGNNAFYECTDLTSVTIPDSVTEIGNFAFAYCRGLTSITIPNSVTTIGDNAFRDCIGLTEVTIGNSVTTIGNFAFSGCRGLTEITIPDSVTTIGDEAFSGCSGLTSVTIGNSVTDIGDEAFSDCTSLTSITSLAITPPTIQFNTFREVPGDCPIYVPSDSHLEYMDAEGWSDRADCIQPI